MKDSKGKCANILTNKNHISGFTNAANNVKSNQAITSSPFPMCWPVGSYPSKDQYIKFVIDWYDYNVDILEIYEMVFPDIADQYEELDNHAADFLKQAAAHEYDNLPTTDMIFSELFSDVAYEKKKYYLKHILKWRNKAIEHEMKKTCDMPL